MGLLDRVNRKATGKSVLWRALKTGVCGGLLGAAVVVLNGNATRATWLLGWLPWTLLCGLMGALFEWQVPDDDLSDDDLPDDRLPDDPSDAQTSSASPD